MFFHQCCIDVIYTHLPVVFSLMLLLLRYCSSDINLFCSDIIFNIFYFEYLFIEFVHLDHDIYQCCRLHIWKWLHNSKRRRRISYFFIFTITSFLQEILPLGSGSTDMTSPEDELPDYLPEDDIVVKDAKSAMAPTGSFKETASSWFATASNLLQKSFYWWPCVVLA